MAKGVAHAGKGKSLSSGEARENERRGWTEDSYRRKNRKPWNNYDWSRHGLNFEIKDGRIIPLGSQSISLYNRYQNLVKELNFKEYKAGATNKQHTYVELILSGSTAKMQKIAFGNQKVNYQRNPETWQNWGVTRQKSIEEWAMDVYNFVCKKYGKENIIGFEVHLDETEPHIHVNIVPAAIKLQRGRADIGYHKIVMMEDGKPKLDDNGETIPATYTKGKHVGEVIKISEKKYNELSDEKKWEYRKNVRGTVRTISYATYFGDKLKERSEKLSELHDEYYNEIGKKWGFERGDVWAELSDDERRERMRRTKQQRWEELQAELAKQKAIEKRDVAIREKNIAVKEAADQQSVISQNKATIDNQDGVIKQQKADLKILQSEKQKVIREKTDAVTEKDAAVRELEESKAETVRNEEIIYGQATTIGKNKNEIEKQEKIKAELQKSIDLMSRIENITYQSVDSYVKDLKGVQIELNKDIRSKLISPLKNHPRIEYTNPPLTAEELERIALEEEAKVVNKIGVITGISNKKANEEIRDIRTDVQTVYFNVVSAKQKQGIKDANENIYKSVRRELAEVYKMAEKYEGIKKEGISEASHAKELKKDASRVKVAEDMLEFAWPGITRAKNILIDPALDKNFMTEEQRKDVLGVLRDNPKHPEYRLEDIMKLLKYASTFRDIPLGTRAEAIGLASENIIQNIAEKGYNLMKEATAGMVEIANELEMDLVNAASGAASAAVCLIFGFLDAATTISTSCGGCGSSNDLPKKKDDEDEKKFFGRCLMTAMKMMKPQRKFGVKR